MPKKAKQPDDEIVVFHGSDGQPRSSHSQPIAMECVYCGLPRRLWSKSKISRPNSLYCTDDCRSKASHERVPLTTAQWNSIMKRDDGLCRYCGAPASQVDHVIPYSKGGQNEDSNLVAACQACNYSVGDKSFSTFDKKKAWILRKRGLVDDGQEIEQTHRPKRFDWRKRVYGGLRGLLK